MTDTPATENIRELDDDEFDFVTGGAIVISGDPDAPPGKIHGTIGGTI